MPKILAILAILMAAFIGLSACGDAEATTTPAPNPASTSTASSTTPAATSTVAASTDLAPTTSSEPELKEETTMATDDTKPACTRLTDFSTSVDNGQWVVVNDDVMGGRSLGGMSFENNTMIFSGEVNTNGGGFASLRLPLATGTLTEFSQVAIRARPDERTYVITFDDNLQARNRRVTHRAPIPFHTPGQWQTITVPFEDLFPAIFGQPIDDLPFRPDLATRMGLMISDGLDGPFQLDVDWIDLCP